MLCINKRLYRPNRPDGSNRGDRTKGSCRSNRRYRRSGRNSLS